MVTHTQVICRLLLKNRLSVFDHFMGLVFKGLSIMELRATLQSKIASLQPTLVPRLQSILSSWTEHAFWV